MQRLSNALYNEVDTFAASVDAEIGDCLRRKVDELTEILAPLAVQTDPARTPEGGTGGAPQPAADARERLERLLASLDECDRMAQGRGTAVPDLAGELRRVRSLFADTIAAVRTQLGQ